MGLWNLSRTPFHRMLSPEEGRSLIKAGYRKGIRFFDTAYSYGDAESILRGAMNDLHADDWHVISKVMPVPTLRKKAETTLRRIGRDHVDIMLLHWPAEEERLLPALKDIERLMDEGKALAAGVSNFPLPLLRKIIRDFPVSFHERPLSLIWTRDWEEEKDLELKTIAYAPLGMGLLSGKYRKKDDMEDERKSLPFLSSPSFPALIEAMERDPAIALSWVYGEKPWGIASGYARKEDLRILDRIIPLSGERRQELRKLADQVTAACHSDNIFSHDWRGHACTVEES